MNFARWLTEVEQQMVLPDAAQFTYIGCVLEKISQDHLVSMARKAFLENVSKDIPHGWTIRAHHMTVKFKPQSKDMQGFYNMFGETIELAINGIAIDENAVAVLVSPSPRLAMSQTPHITVAHSNMVSPVYSNQLIGDKKKIHPVSNPIPLISILLAVKHDQTQVWPKIHIPLASPSQVL